MLHAPSIYIASSEERGRGVYTADVMEKGSLIEICPLIIIPPKDVENIHNTYLHDYYFLYPDPEGAACIALGYGSLYNHCAEPNAEIAYDVEQQQIHVYAIREIVATEEILIDYSAGEGDQLWFDVQ